MTTADDLYDDDPQDAPDPQADERARREAAFAQRKQAREAERAELAELRAYKAEQEREKSVQQAKAALNAEGPLNAFLRTYTGEPTPDAIKAAVEADPDFKDLVTFTPDPRDAAAAEQADNARKLAGGGASLRELTAADVHAWPMERKESFRESHPDAWRTLMSTGTVSAPAGWA